MERYDALLGLMVATAHNTTSHDHSDSILYVEARGVDPAKLILIVSLYDVHDRQF